MLVLTVLFPLFLLGSDGAKYMGCYKDPFDNKRLLSGTPKHDDDKMTNDLCKTFCKGKGFRYAGTQYEEECFCSNQRPTHKFRSPEDQCNTPCRGNKKEICGGHWRLSVYDTSDNVQRENLPDYYVGCYLDNANRVLKEMMSTSDLNSPDFCVGMCYHHGFRFAGVEWGKECFCGNDLQVSSLTRSTQCNMPCEGDSSTMCGGSGVLGVYSTGIKLLSGSDLNSVYMGCFVDPGMMARLMVGDVTASPGNLTNKMCMLFCAKRGFRYAGTQWKRECFCSETRPKIADLAAESECSQSCDGDQNEVCGGDFRLSVYDIEGASGPSNTDEVFNTGYMGCYKDYFDNRRLLPDARFNSDDKMTNNICRTFCKEKDFRYAGTQFGNECFCSNRRPMYSSRAPEEQCEKLCSGNKQEICGGDWRLSIHDTSDSSENKNVSDKFLGCYFDKDNRRALDGFKVTSKLNSPDFCIGMCYYYGFRFAGVEGGNECYCGNSIPAKSLATRTDCNMPCEGDPNIVCGGSSVLGVYSTGIKQLSVSELKSVYVGCYIDPGLMNRLMVGDRINRPGNLTNQMCMLFCAQRDFRYAGTQWKNECFCSKTRPNVGNLAMERDCSQACDGDESQMCGGDFRLSVYDTKGKGENSVASQYLGCFEDSEERLLKGLRQDTGNLTPQLCVGFCQSNGYRIAGVQFGVECFCDNDINMSKKVRESDCSSPCSADDKLKCGGQWRLSAYRSSGSQMSPSYVGCFTNEGSERVTVGAQIVTETLTIDFCIGYCLRRGFSYAGTENGKECFCGENLSRGQKVSDDECQTECNGDSQQMCGGTHRLSIFKTALDSGTTTRCESSSTTVNGKTACAGEIVFQEDFRELNLQKWTHDLYMPSLPDYQFVVYQNDPVNIFTRSGMLHIKPTVFDNHFITSGKLSIPHCTGQLYTTECSKEAVFFSILPPVRTARINTKETFSFRYGKVEVRAKLPAGDWIVPEIWLEPKRYSRYGQHYRSGRVRLAMARGNLVLSSGGADIGNRLLETGVVLGVEEDIATLSAKWNSSDEAGWHDQFHTYAFIWKPDDLSFSVDNSTPVSLLSRGLKLKDSAKFRNSTTSQLWNSNSPIAPFDQEFYITIGLSVGGVRDFPEDCINGQEAAAKPWNNMDFKAMAKFFEAANKWKSTWSGQKSLLQVDLIKVTAL